jgi:hypothetical protein
MNTLPRIALIASIAFALNAPAHALGLSGTPTDYGSIAAAQSANREITLDANSKFINVDNGETVTIHNGGKSFTWTFQTFPGTSSFDLKAIAPQDFDTAGVRVYVASNPLYRG